ncbi:MAG: LicD family protein [Clostridia bacterium]|nr:LicD family protein [Clostridia bacterium]
MREITSLDELKKIELEIMKKIHDFCVEKDITYFLAYGTLIGAIRHKGFIPWDDDIDILMKREDYNKFLREFPKWCVDKKLAIANPYTKPYYGRPMTKVFDTRTYLIEPDFRDDDPYGVFVDVWVLDGVPEEKKRKSFLNKVKRYKRLLFASCYKLNKKLGILKNVAIFFAKILNPKKIVIQFDQIASENPFDCSDQVICCMGIGPVTFNREDFSDKILVDFEDARFFAPIGYDRILRASYGDYKELPPEKDRQPHHVINTYWK